MNKEKKFIYGYDVEAYYQKAVEKLQENYPWIKRCHLDSRYTFKIEMVNGKYEFVEYYNCENEKQRKILKSYSGEMDGNEFIRHIASSNEYYVISSNEETDCYKVPYFLVDIGGGWMLEHYIFYRHVSGDYTVDVQAGDRTTGASRRFGIGNKCFQQPTFDLFLDEFEKIIPGEAFGLYKEDLIIDGQLKAFLGYAERKEHKDVEVVEMKRKRVIGKSVYCWGSRDLPIKTNTLSDEPDRILNLWKDFKKELHQSRLSHNTISQYWGIMSSDYPEENFSRWDHFYKTGYYYATIEVEENESIRLPTSEWKETIIPEGKYVVCDVNENNYDEMFMKYVNEIIPEMGYLLNGGICEHIDESSETLELYFPVKENSYSRDR